MNVYSRFLIGENLEYVSILFFKFRTHCMKSLIACKVNTFSRDKQEKILLYVYAFRSNMSKSVFSLAMACFSSLHFLLAKRKRDMSGHIPLSFYI